MPKYIKEINNLIKKLKINEMARIGNCMTWNVDVYSLDHNPPHFHFGHLRINIPETPPSSISELTYPNQKYKEIASGYVRELNQLIKWLRQPDTNMPEVTNLRTIQRQWQILHNTDE